MNNYLIIYLFAIKTSNRMAGFIDNTGATRHAMGRKELNELYKQLENFIADSTPGEVERNQMELARVKTMIAERIRETYKK